MTETFVETASARDTSARHTAARDIEPRRVEPRRVEPRRIEPRRDIEPLLARRREIEAERRVSWAAHGYERMKAGVLKSALRMGGLYRRGIANALRPAVLYLPLKFARLPRGLDGFRILHLSDLH